MAGTYKEILSRFKKDLGNTYQAQKNIVDVSQKYIGLLENAEGGSGAGGIDYSTEEQDTGLKWTDGKKIYQRTISSSAVSLNENSWGTIYNDTSIGNIAQLINVQYQNSNGGLYNAFNYKTSGNNLQAIYFSNIDISAGAKFTIQYTKS